MNWIIKRIDVIAAAAVGLAGALLGLNKEITVLLAVVAGLVCFFCLRLRSKGRE